MAAKVAEEAKKKIPEGRVRDNSSGLGVCVSHKSLFSILLSKKSYLAMSGDVRDWKCIFMLRGNIDNCNKKMTTFFSV